MCSRLSFISTSEKVFNAFDVHVDGLLRTSYNIAPTQHAYIIRNTAPHQLDYVSWGMIPPWHPTGENDGKLHLARAETIFTSTSFRIPIRKKRCIVIADSFYTVSNLPGSNQQTANRFFDKNGHLLALAGVWDSWYKDDYELRSFSIVTNQYIEFPEIRMPVILGRKEDQEKWLSNTELEDLEDLLYTDWPQHILHHTVDTLSLISGVDNVQLHQQLD